MSPMRGDVDDRSGRQLNGRVIVREPQSSGSSQQDDEFVLLLVVPKSLRRAMTSRHDPFDVQAGLAENCLKQLVGNLSGDVGK